MHSDTMKTLSLLFAITLVLLVGADRASAQIKSDPIRVILTQAERSTEVRLTNPTSAPIEVAVWISYGVFEPDSVGILHLDTVGTDEMRKRSCADWVRVFPQRFVMKPKERRNLRVVAVPPPDLPDGEYTARLRLMAVELEKPGELEELDSNEIGTNLRLRMYIGQPLMYRQGQLNTSIDIVSASAYQDSAATKIVVDLKRGGNSPYRGMLGARLYTPDGQPLDSAQDIMLVESDDFRFQVGLDSLAPGMYRLDVSSTLIPRGGAAEISIPAEPSYRSYDMSVRSDGIQLFERTDDPIYMPQPRGLVDPSASR
jgi:P pilus assembly chaperone PapD